MCRSMVDIQSPTAEIRRGKKKIEDRRKKLQGRNIMAPLLHRAAIMSSIINVSQYTLCSIMHIFTTKTFQSVIHRPSGGPKQTKPLPIGPKS